VQHGGRGVWGEEDRGKDRERRRAEWGFEGPTEAGTQVETAGEWQSESQGSKGALVGEPGMAVESRDERAAVGDQPFQPRQKTGKRKIFDKEIALQ